MRWIKLLIPPEWDVWRLRDQAIYFAVTAAILLPVWLVARWIGGWAGRGAAFLLGQ